MLPDKLSESLPDALSNDYDIWDKLSSNCDILDKLSNDYNLLDRLSNDYDIAIGQSHFPMPCFGYPKQGSRKEKLL